MKSSFLFALIIGIVAFYDPAFAQDWKYKWVAYDTVSSDMDTTLDGKPAKYIQQYDTAKIEKGGDSRFFVWTRAMPISSANKMSWREHQVMPDSLYSGYSYAAFKLELDCRDKRYKTWQWMYYDNSDNPVSGLKLNIERPVAWFQATPSLKKLLSKVCN